MYSDITYASCVTAMERLASQRPDLVTLSTAQDLYNLPSAGVRAL